MKIPFNNYVDVFFLGFPTSREFVPRWSTFFLLDGFVAELTFIRRYIQANQVVKTSVLTLAISSQWFQFVAMFTATREDAPIWLLLFNGIESKSKQIVSVPCRHGHSMTMFLIV